MKTYSKIKLDDISLEDSLNIIRANRSVEDIAQYSQDDLDNINTVFALYRELKSLRIFIDRKTTTFTSKDEYVSKRQEIRTNIESQVAGLIKEIEKRWGRLSTEARIAILKDSAKSDSRIVDFFLKQHLKNASELEKNDVIHGMIFLPIFEKYNIPLPIRNQLFRKFIDQHEFKDKGYARLMMAVEFERYIELTKKEGSMLTKDIFLKGMEESSSTKKDQDEPSNILGILGRDVESAITRTNFINWFDENKKIFGKGIKESIIYVNGRDEVNINALFSCDEDSLYTILLPQLTKATKVLKYPRDTQYYKKVDSHFTPLTNTEKDKKSPKFTYAQLYKMYVQSDIFRGSSKHSPKENVNKFYHAMLSTCFGEPTTKDIDFIESIYYEALKHPEIIDAKTEELFFPGDEKQGTDKTKSKKKASKELDAEEINQDLVDEYIESAKNRGITYNGSFSSKTGGSSKEENGVRYYEFQMDKMKFLVPIGQRFNAIRIINTEKPMREVAKDMQASGWSFDDLVAQGRASRFYSKSDADLYDPNRLIIFDELIKRIKLFSESPELSEELGREGLTLTKLKRVVTNDVPFEKVGTAAEVIRHIFDSAGVKIIKDPDGKDVFVDMNDGSTSEVAPLSQGQIKKFTKEAHSVITSSKDKKGYYSNIPVAEDEAKDKKEGDISHE